MRYQQLAWSCGPAAAVNAARCLGKKIAEARFRSLAGTTKADGTNERGLIDALRGLGFTATPHSSADRASAWSFARANLDEGRPCLLCIDNWGHWVTAVGIVGDRILIADPTFAKSNRSENGIHPMSKTELLRRWRHRSEQESFYAIAVGR